MKIFLRKFKYYINRENSFLDIFTIFSGATVFIYIYCAFCYFESDALDKAKFSEIVEILISDFYYIFVFLSTLFLIGFVLNLLKLTGFPRILMKGGCFTLFLLVYLEFVFYSKTGGYFPLSMLIYSLTNWGDVSQVLHSGIDISSVYKFLVMTSFFLACLLACKNQKAHKVCMYSMTSLLVLCCGFTGFKQFSSASNASSMDEVFTYQEQGLFSTFLDIDFENPVTPKRKSEIFSVNNYRTTSENMPNIIVFVSESTRADMLPGFSGNIAKAKMPNVEWLGSHGTIYDRAYTTTSHTSKALVGILCGIFPFPHTSLVETRPDGIPVECLPKVLGQHGYQSLYISSATTYFENRTTLVNNIGFDVHLPKEAINKGFQLSGYFGSDEMIMFKPFTDWWSEAKKQQKKRFSLFLTSMTHHPYQELGKPVPPSLLTAKSAYLNNLSYSDVLLGKVIDFLRSNGDLENTLILFVGDHGEAFGEHSVYQHDAVPFEEGIRIPLILFDGRSQEKKVDHSLRQHIDIFPTVMDKISMTYSGEFPGKSLDSPKGHNNIITSCWGIGNCKTFIQDDGIKWILYPAKKQLLAFSLAEDPRERKLIVKGFPAAKRKEILFEIDRWTADLAEFYFREDSTPQAPGQQARVHDAGMDK
ncbi:MAG: sulfatase [Azoarcus sp.]|jgi:arylsulfatase A-like enzyme|nr:sulfatase [Azoarcus sp.]